MPKPTAVDEAAWVDVKSTSDLNIWLAKNYTTAQRAWMILYKKGSPHYIAGVDNINRVLLAYGWIDGRVRKLDQARYLCYICPRRKGSNWCTANKALVEHLLAENKITEFGKAVIRQAQADGSWDRTLVVDVNKLPDDLQKLLDQNTDALEKFLSYAPSRKKDLLIWLASAKRLETRQKRLQHIVNEAAQAINTRRK